MKYKLKNPLNNTADHKSRKKECCGYSLRVRKPFCVREIRNPAYSILQLHNKSIKKHCFVENIYEVDRYKKN